MTDVHDKITRSKNMRNIKSRNTKPELIVRKYLFSQGFRYRIHVKYLPGKPDIVLSKYNTVIFVHGCFFHGHDNCPDFKWPKSNVDFWKDKITGNKSRDLKNNKLLKNRDWNVITIFECQLKSKNIENTLVELVNQIKINQ